MRISVITPTCDRPVGIRLLEKMVQRQTLQPDEWIVGDGGETKAMLTMGQRHIHAPQLPGAANFTANVIHALEEVSGDVVIVLEDDDWIDATHIERMVRLMADHPTALAAGDDEQRYYNLPHRVYRTFDNIGASLCQTAVRREAIPLLFEQALDCQRRKSYGLDSSFWRHLPLSFWAIERMRTVVGLKGLPGQPGLGIGHRPAGQWTADPDGMVLLKWIGPDAAAYELLTPPRQPAV